MTTNRSPLGPLATALAVLALGLGGYAALTGSQARGAAEDARADVAALRTHVDSLAQRLPADTTTAGRAPVLVDSAATLPAPAAVPAPAPPPPAAPATRPRTPNGR